METVGRLERQKLNGGASIGRDVNRFGIEHVAIQREGHRSLGGIRVDTRNYCLNMHFFRVVDLARRRYAFHHPVGLFGISNRMKNQVGVRVEAQIGERRRERRFLHVAHEVNFQRRLGKLRHGAQGTREFSV